MNEEYYRKIPVSTPPEKGGEYDTNLGKLYWSGYNWQLPPTRGLYNPNVYFLPIPSEELALINPTEYRRGFVEGEQSQMRKAESIAILFGDFMVYACCVRSTISGLWYMASTPNKKYTTSELYNSEEFQTYLKEKLEIDGLFDQLKGFENKKF